MLLSSHEKSKEINHFNRNQLEDNTSPNNDVHDLMTKGNNNGGRYSLGQYSQNNLHKFLDLKVT